VVTAQESIVGTNTDRDFASLLDDLFVARAMAEEAPAKPTIPFDYLAVADELYSGRIRVASEAATPEYREASETFEAGFAALLSSLDELVAERTEPQEELPSVDPEAIARELNLAAGHSPSTIIPTASHRICASAPWCACRWPTC
jgi:hypothetical protein